MSQAINILTLAHLAQNPVSSTGSKTPPQLLLTPRVGSQPPGLLGTIVSQSNHEGGAGKTPNPGTVNVLIGHLTSGSASPSPSAPSESSTSTRSSPGSFSEPRHLQKQSGRTSAPPPTTYPSSSPAQTTASSEDLSNLNLLSSLVAVVAGSQAPPTLPSHTHTSTSTRADAVVGYSFAKTTTANFSPLALTSTTGNPRSSAFKATNLPAALTQNANSEKSVSLKELNTRTKMHEKASPLSPLINSEHSRTSSRSPVANLSPLDNLARSVVRSSSLTHPQSPHSTTNSSSHAHTSHPSYPSPSPSISQQSTLLLYTRSLSLPNPSGTDVSSEEEDHLESATRGISELSKLLGTDSGAESLSSGSENATTPTYRNSWEQGPGAIPPPMRTSRGLRGGSPVFSAKSELGNDSSKYLSGLLESHTSHSSSHSQNASSSSSTNSTDVNMSR